MARLLLVDDDRFILQALVRLLAGEGLQCVTAVSAGEAARRLAAEAFDLMVLDVGLPDGDGFALCRRLRTQFRLPILLLTARGDSADKVIGLEVGADDYVTKPFEPRELVARVRALLRRAGEYNAAAPGLPELIELGRVVVDVDARDALREGRPVHLTQREFELLHLLARHRNKALATEWIFEQVWGYDADLGPKALTVCVQRLRRKIEADPAHPQLLRTVRRFGYKLVAGDAADSRSGNVPGAAQENGWG